MKRDQHAHRKHLGALRRGHHEVSTQHQNAQAHHLFHAVGKGVVGVSDLLGAKRAGQKSRKVAAITLLETRLHLQSFDGLKASDMFGDKGLVTGAKQKLFIELALKDWGHHKAGDGDQEQNPNSERRQNRAVPDHHPQADHQKRQIEHQTDGGTGDELPDVFHGMHTCCDHTGRAMLEVAHGQFKQMLPDRRAQNGVHTVARMENEILPRPAHQSIEDDEDRHSQANRNQRTLGSVRDDLVDDGLREVRRRESHNLQCQRGQQDISPHFTVSYQLRNKPAKAKDL